MENGPWKEIVQREVSNAPGSLGSTQVGLRRIPPSEEVQTTLRLYRPDARKVFIVGTFNGWRVDATPLTNAGNGEWDLSLMLKPGTHEYRFLIDGQWSDDPQATDRVKNPYGGWNSVLKVGPRTIRLPVLPPR
jgi:1,4-alpha-glucan branching enzyme